MGKNVQIFLNFTLNVCFAETLTVIGIGKLGLCLALSLEKAGFEVVGVDLIAVGPEAVTRP